ncbi:uncharacterized protein K02A2.6-like [Uranotaenia lowii]|uniref:uncharacterized protein K02A2.6-like n=1 Tax=Uranotaenia lowii TaxID=190385 RepID=UPI002478D9AD|nr:uncharacterized protein K02A2.6-like [Uranotaenia lowii]
MLAGVEGVIVYIDDIVVAGQTRQQHDARLEEVLSILRDNNASLNKEKCMFGVEQLEILGYNVSAAGISPSEEKISAIRNFRQPETREEVRSFLGLINFVGQFIPDLSTRTEPLRRFMRGDVETFGEDQVRAFDELRNELSGTVRRLGFFDAKDTTELYVDASPVGLGAVLSQRDKFGTPRIISFASKGLTKAERVYPQTQREALAVVWGVEKFYPYLFGIEFTVFTDHKTLEYIYGGKHRDGKRACSRAEGWALRLQPYNFRIEYIPGSNNISDILSRLCPQSEFEKPFDDESEHYLCAIEDSLAAITLEEIRTETANDETLSAVIKAIHNQKWPSSLFRYETFSKELGVIHGIVVRDDRIVLPPKLRSRALDIAHRGHPGVVSMRRNLREKVWWPYMDRDVGDRIQECGGCAAVSLQSPAEPMLRKEMPERAWQEIAVDFFSAKECATFLVVVDYYSRYIKVIEMKGTTASKTIEALESVFQEQTYPETLRSDNGPPFSSEEFSSYCTQRNIRLVRTIPYWPQMNGLVERQNQGILRALKIAKAVKADWRDAVKDYVHMYNTTPHSMTGKAPLELLTGRPVKDLLPSLRTEPYWNRDDGVRDDDAIKKMKGKIYADNRRHSKPSNIVEGDTVILKNYETGKLEPNFRLEEFMVIKKNGNDTIVANREGVRYRRPVSHLRKWHNTPKENGQTSSEGGAGKERLKRSEPEKSEHQQSPKRPKRSRRMPAKYIS